MSVTPSVRVRRRASSAAVRSPAVAQPGGDRQDPLPRRRARARRAAENHRDQALGHAGLVARRPASSAVGGGRAAGRSLSRPPWPVTITLPELSRQTLDAAPRRRDARSILNRFKTCRSRSGGSLSTHVAAGGEPCPPNDIGVAVIGAGMAGRAHAAGYRSATTLYGPAACPPCASSPSPTSTSSSRRTRAGASATPARRPSWQAVAEADDVDVVSVVVANHLHREVVEGLLAAGKHVLCEKPFAPTVADAEAMVGRRCRAEPDLRAGVGFTFRRSPGHRRGQGPGRRRLGRAADPLQRPLLVRLRRRAHGADELAVQGRPGIGGARRHRQPPRRPRRVPLRADRVRAGHDVRDDHHRARAAAGSRGRARGGRAQRRPRTGRERGPRHLHRHLRLRRDGDPRPPPGSRWGTPTRSASSSSATDAAATFDLSRPGEISYIDRTVTGATAGYRTVPIGPAHPYLTGGLPMDFPGVGYGQNDLFAFQARAFLEQVAGVAEPAAGAVLRARVAQPAAARRRHRVRRRGRRRGQGPGERRHEAGCLHRRICTTSPCPRRYASSRISA